MKTLYEDDIMPVGKYRDMPIKDIIEIDPGHIKRFNHNKYAISDIVLNSITTLHAAVNNHALNSIKMKYVGRSTF